MADTSGTVHSRNGVGAVEERNVVLRAANSLAYRRSVQLFFVNEQGQFLICCPVGNTNQHYRQTVQGGSQEGETPMQTAIGEAWEEIGLDLVKDAVFLMEVLPPLPSPADRRSDSAVGGGDFVGGSSSTTAGVLATTVENEGVVNSAGEVVSEYRAAFRYHSRHWRSRGIHGQEMYPLLFFLPRGQLERLDVQAWRRGVRPEFHLLYWGPLSILAHAAPPVKRDVMAVICPAVAAAALPFLRCWGYPLTGLGGYTVAEHREDGVCGAVDANKERGWGS
ncbi:NUDIX hydrolase dihydroneopterin triphosphate pyrophosphohydrolase/hydrolase [Novymonas esmeraldas]|uniref:NUDIX hydrolase dihydroneopterin triphosphate pyrophosphohydrolase/hydrolase n=1 Tax=Novymonas esmeraldas TaxID=1808958 RepID=A0AAW0F1R2_9TRYP